MTKTNMRYYSCGDYAVPVFEIEQAIINQKIIEQDKTNELRNIDRLNEWKRKKLDGVYYAFFKKLRG